jgi:hypothetical protein
MRTIKMEMTWTAAAQIIAAALENGTGEGREAARAELMRMALILDSAKREAARDGGSHAIRTNTAEAGKIWDAAHEAHGTMNNVSVGYEPNAATLSVWTEAANGGAMLRDLVTALDRAGLLD